MHRNIKRRSWLVQQKYFRFGNQSTRYRHALSLTTRKLMRKTEPRGFRQCDFIEDLFNPLVDIADTVNQQKLAQNTVDGLTRMQRSKWILKHHLHLTEEGGRPLRGHVFAVERDAAAPLFVEAGHGAQNGGLARTAFAYNAKTSALLHTKGNTLDDFAIVEADAELINIYHEFSQLSSRLRTGNRSRGCIRDGMQLRSPLV